MSTFPGAHEDGSRRGAGARGNGGSIGVGTRGNGSELTHVAMVAPAPVATAAMAVRYDASLGGQKTLKHDILRVLRCPIYKYLR
jgi:hypothetical protein